MKEQAKIMRRRENLELEPKGSQTTPKLEWEEKKREKMIMTIFGKCKIVFIEMDKFQQWIVKKDALWENQVGVFSLLSM